MNDDFTAALARAEGFGYLNALSTIPRDENPYVGSDMFDEATLGASQMLGGRGGTAGDGGTY